MIDWQTAVAISIVGVAIIVLLQKTLALCLSGQQRGCGGGCSSCDHSAATGATATVELVQLARTSEPGRSTDQAAR